MTHRYSVPDATKGRLTMQRASRERGGFLTECDVKVIANDPTTRLQMLLVRCGSGRFMAPAQDVQHFISIVDGSGEDYVRDVSVAQTRDER